jgi:peptidoglycan hydrolase FlgJ
MAFNPRSDIVQEVINAADPSRASLAAERLSTLGQVGAAKGDFAADLARASGSSLANTASEGMSYARAALASAPGASDPASRAKVEFETMLTNSFVQEILPKDTGGVYGQGFAGDMWRSMLSEQVSRQIAKSGALGLGRRLFATHDLPRVAADSAARMQPTAQMSANALSAPDAVEISKGAILFAGARRA